MKKIMYVLMFTLCVSSVNLFAKAKQAVIKAELDCSSCKRKIMNELAEHKGIENLKVVVPKNMIAVKYNSDEVKIKEIVKELEKLGYDVSEYVVDGKEKVKNHK